MYLVSIFFLKKIILMFASVVGTFKLVELIET